MKFDQDTVDNSKDESEKVPGGHQVKLDNIDDEWAYKSKKKDKGKKKNLKGGASRGHEKILEDLNKAFNDRK